MKSDWYVRAFSLVFATYLSEVSKFSRYRLLSMTLTFIVVTRPYCLPDIFLNYVTHLPPLFCSSFLFIRKPTA